MTSLAPPAPPGGAHFSFKSLSNLSSRSSAVRRKNESLLPRKNQADEDERVRQTDVRGSLLNPPPLRFLSVQRPEA